MKLSEFFLGIHRLPLSRPAVLFFGVLLIAIVAILDYLTGVEIGVSIFYVIPVAFVTWKAGRIWGLTTVAICTFAWLMNDWWIGGKFYSQPMIPLWNSAIRGGYFTIISILLGRLKSDLAREAEISRSKTELLAMVSHEFGNHLAVLDMGIQLLQGGAGQDPVRLRRTCEMMERNCKLLDHSVLNLLNYARSESGAFVLNIRPTELRKLMDQTLAALAPLVTHKNIQVERVFPVNVIPLNADPDSLLLVMANLIGNAIKYTPQNGRVTVRLVPPHPGSHEVVVSVEDTGIGIGKEDLKGILSLFHRTKSGEEFAKGHGVGLKVVKDILESHKTRLEVSSEPGVGSRFYFRLPIAREDLSLASRGGQARLKPAGAD